MCPRNFVDMKLGDMQPALFKKIINEAANFLPVALVPFFRGESLLHHDFLEMLSYAKGKGIAPIQLATNAYFLNSTIARRIIDLEIDFISFSVDANSPRIYEKIRKNSDFKRVFSNILDFISHKKNKGAKLPFLQVSAVKTDKNKLFISDFINFWRDKVDRVRIYRQHSLNGELGRVKAVSGRRKPCLKLLTDMVVYWNGDVALCNHDWQRNVFIGNVNNRSLEDIFGGAVYNCIRGKHLNNTLKGFMPCESCSHWKVHYQKRTLMGEAYEKI
jgi:radical SAM protein with 4Fe4S-binding SPASM domain